MPNNIGFYLRMMVPGDKEFAVSNVGTSGEVAVKFTSALEDGHTRKHLFFYNNTNAGSGEVLLGHSDDAQDGMILPKGELVSIPLAGATSSDASASTNMDIYIKNEIADQKSNLRVLEIA